MKKLLFLLLLFAACKQPTAIDVPQTTEEEITSTSDSIAEEKDSIFCRIDFSKETIETTTDPEPGPAIAKAAESLQYQKVVYNGA